MPVNQSRYVIVNIWTNEKNPALPGANCGHVSLTTPARYMSLWPQGVFDDKSYAATFFGGNFEQRPASFKTSYEEDCALEGYCDKTTRRRLSYGDTLAPNEVMCRINTKIGIFEIWSKDIPQYADPDDLFFAVKPVQANFRMALYTLDVAKIEREFDRLKTTVTGWVMAGSNMLTRTLCTKTSENCSSLAFRCLNAGGLSGMIATRLSSTTSSAVAPDDLLRCIVALKEREPKETAGFTVVNTDGTSVALTSLTTLKAAFEQVGLHANAEDDLMPNLKPANVRCLMM